MRLKVPYSLYDEQQKYIELISEGIRKGRPLLLEAGTGFGKTISNLVAVLPLAIKNQEKIAYLSRTHTQNGQVLLELKKILKVNPDLDFKSVQIASRQQLCHIRTVSNSPTTVSSILCQKNREMLRKWHQKGKTSKLASFNEIRECFSPFSRLDGATVLEQLPSIVTLRELKHLHENVGGCAYLASRDLLSDALLFTGHYNYFLDPEIRSSLEIPENVHLILDEGHNLENIACAILSESLNTTHLDQAISFASMNHFTSLLHVLKEIKSKLEQLVMAIPTSQDQFYTLLSVFHEKNPSFFPENLFHKLSKLYNDKKEKIEELYQRQMELDQVKSPFQRILSFIDKMTSKGIYEYYGLIIEKKRGNFVTYKLACLDPSLLLKSIFFNAKSVIICSGTLSPLDLNAELLGIPQAVKRSFDSITSEENVLLLQVSKGFSLEQRLSTKFSDRSTGTFATYRTVLLDLLEVIPGGILVFVPSYSIMKSLNVPLVHDGVNIIQEDPKLRPDVVLDDFRQHIVNDGKAMLIGVYGGRFSEGANFPQKEARCVACVGIPYPPINDPWVRLKREYYNRHKKGLGTEWYAAQAFQKVAQALGRGWRGKDDYAVGLLLDERFGWRENIKKLPSWLAKRTIKTQLWPQAREKIATFFKNRR